METLKVFAALYLSVGVVLLAYHYLIRWLNRRGVEDERLHMDLEGDRGWAIVFPLASPAGRIYRTLLYIIVFVTALAIPPVLADQSLWLKAAALGALCAAFLVMRNLGPFMVFVGVDAHRVVVIRLSWFTRHLRGTVLDEASDGGWWEVDRPNSFLRTLRYHSASGRTLSFQIVRKNIRTMGADLATRFSAHPPTVEASPSEPGN